MSIPSLPSPYAGRHIGNVSIAREDFTLTGMIVGTVHVSEGGRFFCHGKVEGDVYVDGLCLAVVGRSSVVGNLDGPGTVEFFEDTPNDQPQ